MAAAIVAASFPPAAPMKPLRIATLNCLNLALPGRRIYSGLEPYAADEYIAKTQWLAAMFDRLAADFVLVQEVFHEQALSDVVRQTAGGARRWSYTVPHAAQDNDKPRLGLVWGAPWQPRLESIEGFSPGEAVPLPEAEPHAAFSRPLLRAEVELAGFPGGRTLTLLNVHLKSRRPEFAANEDGDDPVTLARAQLRSLIMRGAEAAALRRLVIESTRRTRSPLVVAGDFNDEVSAVTTRIVADTSWKAEDRSLRDFMLFDVLDVERRLAPGRRRDVAFSILHGGEPERIDHILVSEEFVLQSKHAIGEVVAVDVFSDHLLERRRAGDSGLAIERIYSDHAAVRVTIVPLA
jgi:endonuclease/exonuclease/phosphatase family metal-dependent hydrolase